ncbi:MAG: 2-oxoacid:acceptor oxidoreductase family protein [Phycisphaerae bacterium]|nr:2-oxoacid:acceptor oxidoreductase family protein [Phycisphaerae bacterium]
MSGQETKIVIAGFGGQGVVVAGNIIARACVIEGRNVTGMISYGAEMRGGTANATVVISEGEIASPVVETPDMAIIMNQPSLDKFEPVIAGGGLLILNTSLVDRRPHRDDLRAVQIAASQIAHELGNVRVANIVALGAFIRKTKLLRPASVEQAIADLFASKKAALVELNIRALNEGMARLVEAS